MKIQKYLKYFARNGFMITFASLFVQESLMAGGEINKAVTSFALLRKECATHRKP